MEESKKYVGAPYNFIPLWDNVKKTERTDHNSVDTSLYTGELDYMVTAETDILISDGKVNYKGSFFKNERGIYTVPGSTIRGLVRTNVQILGQSNLYDEMDDYTFLFRDFFGANKEYYEEILGIEKQRILCGEDPDSEIEFYSVKNVKAGYMVNDNEHYMIYKTGLENDCLAKSEDEKILYGERNYYILKEKDIFQDKTNFEYLFEDDWSFQNTETPYDVTDRDGNVKLDKDGNALQSTKNRSYQPGWKEVFYKADGTKVISVKKPGVEGGNGWIVSSGYFKGKQAIYLIPKPNKKVLQQRQGDWKNAIRLRKEEIDIYRRDIKKKGIKSGYYCLPERGKGKPVFYAQHRRKVDGEDKVITFFGFTPMLRLLYPNTVKNGLPEEHKKEEFKGRGLSDENQNLSEERAEEKLDYVQSIFGKKGYKSKVSFSDAVCVGEAVEREEQCIRQFEPKTTSYLDYLEQDNPDHIKTYKDDFRLRGVKQYWLRNEVKEFPEIKGYGSAWKVNALQKGACFQGKIRFHNLTETEFCLLLYSIRPEEATRWNVGMIKAYGYGRVKLDITGGRLFSFPDLEELPQAQDGAGNTLEALFFQPFKVELTKERLEDFKEKGKIFSEDSPSRATLLKMKNSEQLPNPEKIRYMKASEYNGRTGALPRVEEVLESSETAGGENSD